MNSNNLRCLLAAQAAMVEVEGMKAENAQREVLGQSMAYVEADFVYYANVIHGLKEAITDD